jgi:hypothetical protein
MEATELSKKQYNIRWKLAEYAMSSGSLQLNASNRSLQLQEFQQEQELFHHSVPIMEVVLVQHPW